MSRTFQERFKDRIRVVGPQGDIEDLIPLKAGLQTPTFPLQKSASDMHLSRPTKAISTQPINTSATELFKTSSVPPTSHHSPGPLLRTISEVSPPFCQSPQRSNKKALSVPKSISAYHFQTTNLKTTAQPSSPYTPYTLKEYQLGQLKSYVELKGLGSGAGSQDWERRKEMKERQIVYSRKLFVDNANRLGYLQAKPKERRIGQKQMTNARVRALEFAKSIKLPGMQTPRHASSSSDAELKAVALALKAKLLL
jgi:hypothetical protein